MGPAGLCRLLAALAAIPSATAALPPNTHEFDLVFPRAGGRYALATPDGGGALPVVLAVQNPDSAYHFGFQLWWDVYEQPHRADFWDHFPRFSIRADLGNDTTFPGDFTHLATAVTDALKAGATYTFHWRLRTGPWCEYLPGSAEYRHSHEMANGSFEFAVEAAAAGSAPTFTGTCPSALGVAAFASTTVYRGLPFFEQHADPATQTLSCGVMANATTTVAPEPCSATVGAAQETSISSAMQWGTFATATATATQTGAPSAGHVDPVVSWPLMMLSTALIWGII